VKYEIEDWYEYRVKAYMGSGHVLISTAIAAPGSEEAIEAAKHFYRDYKTIDPDLWYAKITTRVRRVAVPK
jgi:hypothetical protein